MDQYHITFKNQEWRFSKANSSRSIKNYSTKEEALEGAIEYMNRLRTGGSLVVHLKDGSFQKEYTYPRSIDPRRSPG